MKNKYTTQELINALDCWLNPNSAVDCEDCPFHSRDPLNPQKPGTCREVTLRAVTERLQNDALERMKSSYIKL